MLDGQKIGILNARKIYYLLFAEFFMFSESQRFANCEQILNLIKSHPLSDECVAAVDALLLAFADGAQTLVEEFDEIFHAPPRPLHNTFSYYHEGYSSGFACVNIKKILAKTAIRKNSFKFKENEDNIGFVMLLMAEFIASQIEANLYEDEARELFCDIINPFIDEFVAALRSHSGVKIYKHICDIFEVFIQFERAFYGVAAQSGQKSVKSVNGLSRSEFIRREANRARRESEKRREI